MKTLGKNTTGKKDEQLQWRRHQKFMHQKRPFSGRNALFTASVSVDALKQCFFQPAYCTALQDGSPRESH